VPSPILPLGDKSCCDGGGPTGRIGRREVVPDNVWLAVEGRERPSAGDEVAATECWLINDDTVDVGEYEGLFKYCRLELEGVPLVG